MHDENDELLIDPGSGVHAWHNAAGGISLIGLDAGPETPAISLSYEDALRLAKWLGGECSRDS